MVILNTKEFFALDPYDAMHISMLQQFEQSNKLDLSFSTELLNISQNYNREQYLKTCTEQNELNQHFCYCKNNVILGHCIFYIQKDIKTCHITFTKSQNPIQNIKLISLATTYALNTLGMEEVFSSTSPTDATLITYLTNSGYENLGTDDGLTCFVIEKTQLATMEKNNGIS